MYLSSLRDQKQQKSVIVAIFIQFSYARGASKKLYEARTMYLASLRAQTAKKVQTITIFIHFS